MTDDATQAAAPTTAQKSPPKPTATSTPLYPVSLSMTVVYQDSAGGLTAGIVTKVVDDNTVNLVLFPDEAQQRHIRGAVAVTPGDLNQGWFPTGT